MSKNETERICGYCGLPILTDEKFLEEYDHFFHVNSDCFSDYTIILGIFNWVEMHWDYIHPDFKNIDFHSIKINDFIPIYRESKKKRSEKSIENNSQISVAD